MAEKPKIRLAATLVLARDSTDGLEVFMVVRHHQIDFASGALVFPGGSADKSDRDPRLLGLADGLEGLEEEQRVVRVSAAREAFEECGVLLARPNGSDAVIDGIRAAELGSTYRKSLESGEIGMADIMEREGLRLATDLLAHYAHWITPNHMPKRFDTHFFVAPTPAGHVLSHDGYEAVDSIWIRPSQALVDAENGKRTVIFPTRLNLEKISGCATVEEAITLCNSAPIVTVMPVMKMVDGEKYMQIPAAAGYGKSEYLVKTGPAGSIPVSR